MDIEITTVEKITLILVPFLFMVFNRLRGHVNYDILQGISSRVLFNLIMGLIIGVGFIHLIDISWYWAILFPLSFWAGETPQTGKWIGYLVERRFLSHNDDNRGFFHDLIHIPANAIFNEETNYYKYAFLGLAIRGLIWFGVAMLPAIILNNILSDYNLGINIALIVSIILMGVGFPFSFYISFRPENKMFPYIKYLTGNTCTWTELNWAYGELVYGFIFGLILSVSYLISKAHLLI